MVQAGGSASGRDFEHFPLSSGNSRNSSFAMVPRDVYESVVKNIGQELLDDEILSVVFEVHRSLKKGLIMLERGKPDEENKFLQINADGVDVFGQAPIKKQHECVCPNCSRNLAASRFAPHLEKCMGMGRNSSRIASRRIQNSSRDHLSHSGNNVSDDDDEEWNVAPKRKRRDKNSPRRTRTMKLKSDLVSSSGLVVSHSNGTSNGGGSASNGGMGSTNGGNSLLPSNTLDALMNSGLLEDKKVLLQHVCGVLSEANGKMCTRKPKCSLHTNEQRKAVREQMLGGGMCEDHLLITRAADSTTNSMNAKYAALLDADDVQVDAESLDPECESAPLPLQLSSGWEHDLSNTTSPADSTSTNNSSSNITSSSSSSSSSNSSNSSVKRSSSGSSKTKKKNSRREKEKGSALQSLLE